MPLRWKSLKGAEGFGCEIESSVREVLDDVKKQDAMTQLVLEKGLVLFRGQTRLTPADECALLKLLPYDDKAPLRDVSGPYYAAGTGIIEKKTPQGVVGAARWKLPEHPIIQLQGQGTIRNHFGVQDGELESKWMTREWHTDGCHDTPTGTLPPVATSMYCIESPSVGGETLFASSKEAFRALPKEMQQRALRCECIYDHHYREMETDGMRARTDRLPSQVGLAGPTSNRWPLVIQDRTGEPALYCGPAFTRYVVENGSTKLTQAQAQDLLGEILRIGLADGRIYAHAWQPGDLIIWNNRNMLHSATSSDVYGPRERRLIHRIRMSSRESIIAAARSIELRTAYAVLWCGQQLLATAFFDLASFVSRFDDNSFKLNLASQASMQSLATILFWLLLLAVYMQPTNRSLVVASHLINMVLHARKIPFVWDYEYWDWLVELSVVLCFGDAARAAPLARCQMLLFYYATVFFKFTRSFMSSKVSCAPIFTLSLLDCLWPAHVPPPTSLIKLMAATAPALTILIEFAIPTLLASNPFCGVFLGLFFHLLIALTPPPNNAGGFSVSIAVRYAFFIPAWRERSWFSNAISATLVAAAAVLGYRRGGDWALPVYIAMTCFFLARASIHGPNKPHLGRISKLLWFMVLSITSVYALLLPILGVHDMGAATMFANLKVYAGSNHLLGIPTGVLLRIDPDNVGQIVRVEASTSRVINTVHPNEASTLHSSRLTNWLRTAGHSGRQFAPYVARSIGLSFGDGRFEEPFVVPVVELRRLVREAREKGETDFRIEYTKLGLPPLPDDPVITNALPRVLYDEATSDCRVVFADGSSTDCDKNEAPIAPPINKWIEATMLFFSFPVAINGSVNDELGCIC